MTLSECHNLLHSYIMDNSRTNADRELVIQLSAPSIGCCASVGVKEIYPGIDWDQGRVLIVPEQKIVAYAKDRDSIMHPYIQDYKYPSGRHTLLIDCRRCGATGLKKDMKYCPMCGQRIK